MEREKRIQELAKEIGLANRAYSVGLPTMTDQAFDVLWRELRELDSEHPLLFPLKQTSIYGTNVTHWKPALSLNKAFTMAELLPFLVRFKGTPLLLEPKFDGVFVRLYQQAGTARPLPTLASTASQGLSISAVFDNIPTEMLPKLEKPFEDFELVIDNVTFLKRRELFGANQRNSVSGFLNRQRPLSRELFSCLRFIPHENPPFQEQILSDLLDLPTLEVLLFDLYTKASQEFPLDGVVLKVLDQDRRVLTGHNGSFPHWAIAWKPPMQVVETTVESVEWKVSRTQRLIPTVVYSKVDLCGTSNQRATGNNASWVKHFGIGEGAKIEIGKAGEIIPKLIRVLERVEITLPKFCPNCRSPLVFSEPHLVCPSSTCIGALAQRITHFYSSKGLEVKGIAYSSFDLLLEDEEMREKLFTSPWLLLLLTPFHEDFDKIHELLGSAKLATLMEGVREVRTGQAFDQAHLLAALGLPGIAYKSARAWLLAQLGKAPKITSQIGRTDKVIGQNLDLVMRAFKELPFVRRIDDTHIKTFALTGTFAVPRAEIIRLMSGLGYLFDESPNLATNLLFCASDSWEVSAKWNYAMKHGIPIKREEDLLELINPLIRKEVERLNFPRMED